MKRIAAIFILSLMISVVSFGRFSTKIKDQKNTFYEKRENVKLSEWTFNTRGFIVFDDVSDLNSYMKHIISHSHAEVRAFLNKIGYTSIGSGIYSEMSDETVTDDQVMDYVLSPENIFQVKEVIIRPIGTSSCSHAKYPFILAMLPDNLTDETWERLVAGNYDVFSMNKFAINKAHGEFELTSFMRERPYGYEDLELNSCPSETGESASRFLGTGWTNTGKHEFNESPSETGCACGGWATYTYYTVFWLDIGIGHSDYICKPVCF